MAEDGRNAIRFKEDMRLDMDPECVSDSARSGWDRANGMEEGREQVWGKCEEQPWQCDENRCVWKAAEWQARQEWLTTMPGGPFSSRVSLFLKEIKESLEVFV